MKTSIIAIVNHLLRPRVAARAVGAFAVCLGLAGLVANPAAAMPAAPTISEELATAAGLTTATVAAEINPGGAPSGYHVEYVTEAQFLVSGWQEATRVPVTDVALAAAMTPVPVRQELAGLQPELAYRFRFVASNVVKSEEVGENAMFKTVAAPAGASALPDDRAYELVSAEDPSEVEVPGGSPTEPEPAPAELVASGHFPFRAAAEGGSVVFVGGPSHSGGNGLTGEGVGNEILAQRDPGAGWETSDITPEIASGNEEEHGISAYEFFSGSLSFGVLATISTASFAATTEPKGPSEECDVLYGRDASGYHALFSQTLEPHDCGGDIAGSLQYEPQSLLFAGASADDSQLLFQTPAALTGGTENSPAGSNLYDSVDGRLSLVNVLPDGATDPDATSGSAFAFSNVMSQTGSVAFWSDMASRHIYARLNPSQAQSRIGSGDECLEPKACTVQISGEDAAQYRTATPDGRYAYYTEAGNLFRFDTETGEHTSLTGASYAGTGVGDLTAESNEVTSVVTSSGGFAAGEVVYGPGIPEGTRIVEVLGSTLVLDQAASAAGTGVAILSGGPLVQGVIAVSETGEDGAYVYFVADAALAGNIDSQGEAASVRTCEPSTEEPFASEEEHGRLPAGKGCNLYVWHDDATQFVTALSASDASDWSAELGNRSAEVTPDGRHLVFESRQQLTGYHGEGAAEVFVYDAEPAGLSCASCDPTGTPPVSGGASLVMSKNPTFMHRWISEGGERVFFDSDEALAAQDTNGVQDVYEWERPAAGPEPGDSCTSTASAFSATDDGCVFLLSGGTSPTPSYFIDADASGSDVFFTHRGMLDQLGAGNDIDAANSLYDARVGGGFPQPSFGCSGNGCQSAPAPPAIVAPPASITADGAGNVVPPASVAAPPKTAAQIRAEELARALKACRTKRNRRQRIACEGRARVRFGPPHRAAKKAAKRPKRAAKRSRTGRDR